MLAGRETKIICTIGPASESREMMTKLVENGMNIIRLDFSNGDFEEHGDRTRNIREVVEETRKNITILLDTKGPEVRLGEFENGVGTYEKGDMITIVRERILGAHEKFRIRCPEIFDDVEVGGTILIDDGKMRLTILKKREGELKCRIKNPGQLKSKKGCNLPSVKLSIPFISPRDNADIRLGCQIGVNYIAAFFTKRKEDILAIHRILRGKGKPDVQVIPRIENQEGFDNLEEILEVADGVMVARDDLGVDIPFELVPIYQKKIIKTANTIGKSIVTAMHMLESMQGNPRPTHAGASDVANAVLDGTDAIVLSGGSAADLYPIEAIQTMDRITKAMELTIPLRDCLRTSTRADQRTKNNATTISVADTTMALDAAVVIALTQSDITARRISKFRPEASVVAVTFNEKTQRSLTMSWGVTTVLSEVANNQNNECGLARTITREVGIRVGETIIIIAGYPVGNGATNTMRIIEIK